MPDSNFRIKYSGEDATKGYLPLREYSESIAGLERILHYGIAFSEKLEVPTGRETNKTYSIQVCTPEKGSVDQLLTIVPAFASDVAVQVCVSYLLAWVGLAIKKSAGVEHDEELRAVHNLLIEQMNLANRQAMVIEKAMDELSERNKLLEKIIMRLLPDAQRFTRPLRSENAEHIEVTNGFMGAVNINKEMADSMTAKSIWGEPEELRTRVVGILRPEKRIEISHPDEDRFIKAEVVDPAFNEEKNLYIQAFVNQTELTLVVKIRRHRKNHKVTEILVLHATGE